MAKTEFEEFIQNSIENSKGVSYPVDASLLERLLVLKVSCDKLHPNPEDEFCFPDIGPHYGIISNYVAQFSDNLKKGLPLMEEPLYIQKIKPRGYTLLNGHHRWAAAMRLGIKRVPVRVINTTKESDIKNVLESSDHDRRVTIDLDEVLFRKEDDPVVEKKPGILSFGIQKKPLRQGAPALLSALRRKGFDIWVYSADFYSVDDIKKYFRRYKVGVDGVITGMKKKRKDGGSMLSQAENLFSGKYNTTLHIDNDMMLVTHSGSSDFEEIDLNCAPENWSREAINAVEQL